MTATASKPPLDPLTAASVSVVWVIVLNKPFYPLYVWWLVGEGVAFSLLTMAALPLFVALLLLARQRPLIARAGLPLVGMLDTLFETKLFGHESGTILFLAPCIMLAALSFHADEKWWQRGVSAAIFIAFAASYGRLGAPLHDWTPQQSATLFGLNAFAVASLMAFVALRWPGRARDRDPPQT